MNDAGRRILMHLQAVSAERERRDTDASLAARVRSLKAWQHRRFENTYADMLSSERYRDAATFFLEDLYGPGDFSERDRQFARIVPALVRLFPSEIVGTVASLAELHALSERFDSAMAACLDAGTKDIDDASYARVWREVGDRPGRERQIALMLEVGGALERYTRNPLLRHSLRLMRGPAQAAGLRALQAFLERGFETFRAMRGAKPFLDTVAARELALAAAWFEGGDEEPATGTTGSAAGVSKENFR